jgi:hypothetical protein
MSDELGVAGPRAELALTAVALVLFAVHLLDAIAADRALFADGANFFVLFVTSAAAWPVADDAKHMRLFANLINQLPLALSWLAGLRSLPLLRLLFGAGLFVTPVLLVVWCRALCVRAGETRIFLIALASMVTMAMPSELFVLNQALTASALAWVVLHYALLDVRLRWWDRLLLAAAVVTLFRAHEGVLLWGAVIAAAVAARAVVLRRAGRRVDPQLLLTGIAGIAQSAFAAYWLRSHPIQEQTGTFLNLSRLLWPDSMWGGTTRVTLVVTVTLLALLANAVAATRAAGASDARAERAFTAMLWLTGIALAAGVVEAFAFPGRLEPIHQFESRFFVPFGGALWMGVAALVAVLGLRVDGWRLRHARVLVALGVLSASALQMANTRQWRLLQEATVTVLGQEGAPVRESATVRERLAREGADAAFAWSWPWTWSVYSLSLLPSWDVQRLILPAAGRDWFEVRPRETIVRVPYVWLTPRGPYRLDALLRACERVRCEPTLR